MILLCLSCQENTAQEKGTDSENTKKIIKTNQQWKNQLDDLSFYVLREKGTERAFSGTYDKFYETGTYHCKGCKTPLFKSINKYDSGSGWPSFDRAIEENVEYDTDTDIGYVRTEIHCKVCEGHLGHVFDDGPKKTTGKRYCINSVSLIFEPN